MRGAADARALRALCTHVISIVSRACDKIPRVLHTRQARRGGTCITPTKLLARYVRLQQEWEQQDNVEWCYVAGKGGMKQDTWSRDTKRVPSRVSHQQPPLIPRTPPWTDHRVTRITGETLPTAPTALSGYTELLEVDDRVYFSLNEKRRSQQRRAATVRAAMLQRQQRTFWYLLVAVRHDAALSARLTSYHLTTNIARHDAAAAIVRERFSYSTSFAVLCYAPIKLGTAAAGETRRVRVRGAFPLENSFASRSSRVAAAATPAYHTVAEGPTAGSERLPAATTGGIARTGSSLSSRPRPCRSRLRGMRVVLRSTHIGWSVPLFLRRGIVRMFETWAQRSPLDSLLKRSRHFYLDEPADASCIQEENPLLLNSLYRYIFLWSVSRALKFIVKLIEVNVSRGFIRWLYTLRYVSWLSIVNRTGEFFWFYV